MNAVSSTEKYGYLPGGPVGQARLDLQNECDWRRCGDLIGLDVIAETDGSCLGMVLDVVFDLEENRAVALVLDHKHWLDLMGLHIIPWREITRIGRHAISVDSAEAKRQIGQDEWTRKAIVSMWETAFSSTHILDADGHFLGSLADTCLEDVTGRVLGIEMLNGFLAESLRGKQFLPKLPPRHRPEALWAERG